MNTKQGGESLGSGIRAVLVGFPLVAVVVVALALLFRVFGYRPGKGDLEIPSIIGIVIGTRLIILFREHLQKPSRVLLTLSALGYMLLALLIWARATNRLPSLVY